MTINGQTREKAVLFLAMPFKMQMPSEITRIMSQAVNGETDRIVFFDGTSAAKKNGAWVVFGASGSYSDEANTFCAEIAGHVPATVKGPIP